MGWMQRFRRAPDSAAHQMAASPVARSFSIGAESFPWIDVVAGRVSREQALAVPAVLRGRNMIAGVISTLPIVVTDATNAIVANSLMAQIDPDVPNAVTIAQTVEDLLFDAISWWKVTARGFDGYPTSAQHIDLHRITWQMPAGFPLNKLPSNYFPGSHAFVGTDLVEAADVIRFDSPNPALLVHAARTIRRALKLELAADRFADNPSMRDYFTAVDGADPTDTEVRQMLDDWIAARNLRSTGYVPSGYERHDATSLTPAELQLATLIEKVTKDLANAMGIDAEDLSVSTTSRTYANAVDRRQDRVNETYGPYITAIQDRLSMGDITKRSQIVRLRLDDYMRANPIDRMKVQTGYITAKVFTPDEIRDEECKPPLTTAQKDELSPPPPPALAPPQTPPAQDAAQPDNVRQLRPAQGFSGTDPVGFTFDLSEVAGAFSVNESRREITGLVMPWNTIGRSDGKLWKFAKDSLKYSAAMVNRIKLLNDHDNSASVGRLVRTWSDDVGQWATFKVARGDAGDRALALAADGVKDGLSAGIGYTGAEHGITFGADPAGPAAGVIYVTSAPWRETSLVAMPAFDDARISAVSMAADDPWKGELAMPCQTCGQTHAPGVACPQQVNQAPASTDNNSQATFSAEQVATMLAQRGGQQTEAWTPERVVGLMRGLRELDATSQQGQVPQLGQQVSFSATEAARIFNQLTGAQQQTVPVETPAVVNPVRPANLQVTEAPLYRFDGGKAQRTFSADLAAAAGGDQEARGIVERYMATDMAAMFTNIAPADVAQLNPVPTRPELYVPNLSFARPIGDQVTTGPLDNLIAFIVPKYSSSSGLAGTHTTGTEPSSGAFTTTSQTITPKGLSGRADIDREIIDSGGSPQADQLIYTEMVRAYTEAQETRLVDLFQAMSLSDTPVIGQDRDLQASVTTLFAGLQFVRGGDRYGSLALHSDIYSALANANDDAGRPLFPMIGAVNANGTAASDLSSLRVAGKVGVPAWALASGNGGPDKSFMWVKSSVYQWSSAPRRFTFDQVNVSSVAIAIWGYSAEACTRTSDVYQLGYSAS